MKVLWEWLFSVEENKKGDRMSWWPSVGGNQKLLTVKKEKCIRREN